MLTTKHSKVQNKNSTGTLRYSSGLQYHTAWQVQLPALNSGKLQADHSLLHSVPYFLLRHLCGPTQYNFLCLSPYLGDYSGWVYNPLA